MSAHPMSASSQGPADASAAQPDRLGVLDGWRGLSIVFVLAGHLLPLGPKAWRLNETAGPLGMVLFFVLSGFLITRFLLTHDSVVDFLIRRAARIVPLAWLGMAIALWMSNAPADYIAPHFFFYANLPPIRLTHAGSHLWSLCVEVQFYVGVALLVLVAGRRGLYLLPVLALAVTAHRIGYGALADIVTYRRVDEILAGATLALVFSGSFGAVAQRSLGRLNPYWLMPLVLIASHPESGFMNYLRPYLGAMLVGATLVNPPPRLARLLSGRVLGYLAAVSFALYVFHHLLIDTWLGSGERLEKYLKRPLLFAATFALAHLSTFYFEQRFIEAGKRLSRRLRTPGTARVAD